MKELNINQIKDIVFQIEKRNLYRKIKIYKYGKGLPSNCFIYNISEYENKDVWFIIYSIEDLCLKSSSVIILETGTNKVLYEGSCHDEG